MSFTHTAPQKAESREEKLAKRQMRRQKMEEGKRKEADAETIKEVMQDERFAELFGKQGYGINVADAKFKRTPEMEAFMNEVAKRQTKTDDVKEPVENKKNEIESTVDRIRRRANKNLKNKKE